MKNGDTFRAVLTFDSDWLIGTGRNQPAGLDEVTARDGDELPYVPGTTAIGMVRDGAESVARAFDGADQGVWHEWVHALLGGQARGARPPRRGGLQTRPLRLPEAVRERLRSRPDGGAAERSDPTAALRRALVVTRAGVALDRDTRTARPNMLRFGERARAGMTVEADWTLAVQDLADGAELPWEAELVLLAGMRLVDHIGANRRRGAGRCRLAIDGVEQHQKRLDSLLRAHGRDGQLAAARSPHEVLSAVVDAPSPRVDAAPDTVVEVRIELLSPVIATDTTIGNAVRSLPFLPGATLLPIVQRAFGRLGPLLSAGGLVVTDATLEIDGRRSVPTPLALQIGKRERVEPGAPLTVVTRALAPAGSRPVPVGGFCVLDDDGAVRTERPTLTTQPHAVVDDARQRPTEDSGGLYTYQAIAAGTVLRAEIRFLGSRPTNMAAALTKLSGRHALGRSRKDEYGFVRITATETTQTRAADRRDGGEPDEFVVQLLSDLILPVDGRDATPPERLAATLSDRLGIDLRPVLAEPGAPTTALIRAFRRESWHTRWQLPRPSLHGLSSGSVVRLEPTGTIIAPSDLADRIAGVELAGIGDRTAEGFGQIRLNPPLLTHDTVRLAGPQTASPPSDTEPAGPPPTWWADVERAAWRTEITQRAVDAALRAAVRESILGRSGALTPSQLGTLRLVAAGDGADFRSRLSTWHGRIPPIRRADWSALKPEVLQSPARVFEFLRLPADSVPTALHGFAAQQLLLALLRTAKGRALAERARQDVEEDIDE